MVFANAKEDTKGRVYGVVVSTKSSATLRFLESHGVSTRDEVADEIRKDLPNFIGPIFEDICRDWVGRYSALGEGALGVGSWWSRRSDVEVDVVTLEKKGYGLLGSCKWWRKPVGAAELDDLHRARAVMGPKAAQAKLALFARGGFTPEVVERASLENVALVGLRDLFGR